MFKKMGPRLRDCVIVAVSRRRRELTKPRLTFLIILVQDDDDDDNEAEVPSRPGGVLEEVDLGGCKDGVGVSLAEELFEAAARQVDENQGRESDLL